MGSRYFLVLIAVALVPFVTARQNPSGKAAISQTDLPLKYELNGILPKPKSPLPPKPPHCKPVTAQGTNIYEPLHLDNLPPCPSPPAPTPSPTPGPAPTPTPTSGPSPTPTPTPGPAPTPTPTPGPSPTPTPTPGPAPAPTPAPTLAPPPASLISAYH